MSRRALAVTALVFAALLAVTLVLVPREAPEAPEPYFRLRSPHPDTILVAYGPDTTVVVPGGRTGWRVIRPVDYPADGVEIEALIKRLDPLPVSARRFPLLPEKLDTYGMRHPRAMIRVAYRAGGMPDSLFIGTFNPTGSLDYVRRGGSPEVALVDDRLARGFLLKQTAQLRRTRLLPFPEDRAEGLRLYGPGDSLRVALDRGDRGLWRVKYPWPGPANQTETREYLRSLNHMLIDRFVREGSGPLAPYGLDVPRASARVAVAGGDTLSLALGVPVPGSPGQAYAKTGDRPEVYAVSDRYPPVLLGPAARFRDPVPFAFGLADVDSVAVATDSSAVILALADSASVGRETRDVLANWVLLRARDFVRSTGGTERQWGLDPPAGTVTWIGKGDTLAVVAVGASRDGLRALRIVGGPAARPQSLLLVPEDRAGPLWTWLVNAARRGIPPAAGRSP